MDKETSKEIGKYLVDISKLVFGGVVLATVLKIEDFPKLGVILPALQLLFYFQFQVLL